MPNVEELIEQSEKLVSIFGYWPSFHDAEVVELHFDRGEIDEEADIYRFPELTAKILVWELTSEVGPDGCLVSRLHTLAAIQFRSVDAFSMTGFNYHNALQDLRIAPGELGGVGRLVVHFSGALGLEAKFHCAGVRVLNAIPWPKDKPCPRWLNLDQLAKLGP